MAKTEGAAAAPDQASADQYHRDGFVILKDVLGREELEAVKREAIDICRGRRGEISGMFTGEGGDDNEVMARTLCIHFPHKTSALLQGHLSHPRVTHSLRGLIGPNIKCMQSMLFIKSAGKPGQAWHQDEAFIPTRDRSLAGVWIALDDATVKNGCLWVIPGSHRAGIIWPMRNNDDPHFDGSPEAYGFPFEAKDAVPVELPAGSAVAFNGYLLHRSLQNSAPAGYRRALVNHYMSAESLLPWMNEPDWRDVVLVAGEDPYAYKGLQDRSVPHVRREGMPDLEHSEHQAPPQPANTAR
ncbi:MAG: phytanoyl-CoA dioxygenase family protein [Candidatus Dormibacteria bacterium]